MCVCVCVCSVSSLDRVTEDMCQLLLTLMHMHEKGIAHLDIKPDNILLVNGQVKVSNLCSKHLDI